MPRFQVRGDLSDNLLRSFRDMSGALYVFAGTAIISDPVRIGSKSISTTLTGNRLDMPDSGPHAVTGRLTGIETTMLDFNQPGSVLANDVTLLKIRGLSIGLTDLYDLIARPTPTRATFDFQEQVMIRGLNATPATVRGSRDADTIAPGDILRLRHADRIEGNGGDDRLSGGRGDDTVLGGTGDDALFGGRGRDRLIGDDGDDRLTGGAGADVFVFGAADGNDVVTDFADGVDRLRVAGAHAVSALGEDALVTHDGGTILLVGVSVDLVTAADFL